MTYTVERKIRLKIETDYTSFQSLERLFKSKDNVTYETEYSDKILMNVGIPVDLAEEIEKSVTEITSGKARIENLGEFVG